MTLAAVKGQPRALDALQGALRKGAIHHAWLFGGPEGVGKELAAKGFAQALLCVQAPMVGCGECSACQRVERRNHPDVTWIMPEDEQVARGLAGRSDFTHVPSREIKVEQVRQLQERLSFRALEGRYKVAIVASAERMNTQAQNAFLKTLEEPPPDTVLMLIAAGTDRLLPTIRSRCSKVHFGPLPMQFVADRVKAEKKVDDATASMVAVMSGGSLHAALELDVEGLADRKAVVEQFENVTLKDARTILRFADEFGSSREDAENALALLKLWQRDLAVAKAGGEGLLNRDLLTLAKGCAAKLSAVDIHRRDQLIGQAQYAISQRNGSAKMQLEKLLIEVKRAEARR